MTTKVPRTRRAPKVADTPTTPTAVETPPTESLKIVILLRPPKAVVGVSQPGKDPHMVSLEMVNVQGLEQVLAEVPGIVELARAKWEVSPQYPKYTRPAPPPRPATAPVTRARTAPRGPTTVAPPTPSVERPRML